jgi:hypothetical protein
VIDRRKDLFPRGPGFTPFAIAVVPKVEPAEKDLASLAGRDRVATASTSTSMEWQQGQGGSRPTSGGQEMSSFPRHHNVQQQQQEQPSNQQQHPHPNPPHLSHTHPLRPRAFSNVCPPVPLNQNANPNQSMAPPQIELFKPALPRLPSLSQMLPRGAFPLFAQTLSSGGYSRQVHGGGDMVDGGHGGHGGVKRRRTGSYHGFPLDAGGAGGGGGASAGWTLGSAGGRRDQAGSPVVMVDALV